MSTATKVAIATTAGAVAATAAGLATTEKGRELRQKVTRKIHDLVDAGSITLKKSGIGHVVEEIESVLGGLLHMGRHGRAECADDMGNVTPTAQRARRLRQSSR